MRIPSAALALLLLAPTSCKENKRQDDPGPATPGPSKAESSPKTEAAPEPPPPPKKKALTPEELGTCKLTSTGAIAKEQTTPGGRAATNVTYWMNEKERKSMMGGDGFSVSCHGPDIKFTLIPSAKKDGMPFKPKKYTITKGTGDAGVMVQFGPKTLDGVSGNVDITAFDKHHIAGTLDLKGKLVPGGGEIKLTGSFDLICPGFGNCE
jgi:hypothetical protein